MLDPPTLITSPSMDSNKGQPTTQQPLQQRSVQHLHANPLPALAVRLNSPQPAQLPTNGIVHQLLMQSPGYHQHSSTISQDARTPLLENTHELYGTQHLSDYVKPRQYGTRERENLYSPQTPQSSQSQLPINYDSRNINSAAHAVPLGYNVDVHNAYLLRNPPKEQNQIYQNHQGLYRSPEIDGSNIYTPYTSRLQAPAPSNTEMLKQQYNEIQQMRLQQQMHYQNRAQMHQQQIFAQRQLLLQHMHGVQPPPNLRQDLELIPSKEVEGNRNKKLHDISLGEKESYRQDEFYGKNPSLEKEQSNRKDQLKVKEQTYLREPTFSHKEQGIDTINSQRQQLQRESRERDRYQMQGQQISPPSSKSPESTNPSIKSPSSESRRSSAGTQALRSPTAQRPASAPVTMSGWLYKQGSDGLKVWRKRWFVLSEYCLFYYKSQDEDKLLGSVLLPSYVVRACGADERVSRRYAFKCEHVNMRTLLLAAPDEALKQAWLRALTCAALMQEGSLHEQTNTSNEEVREYGQENDNEMSEEDGSPGHTYANAPPKPRRSNDGYNSPSPERYESNYDLLRKPPSTYNQSIRTPTQAENIYDKQPQENYSGSAPRQTYQNKLNSGPSSSAAETLQISRSYEQQSNQYTDDREDAKSPIYFDDMKTSTYNSITDNRNTERSQGLRQLPDQSILRDLTNWNIYESRNPDTEDSYKRTPDESTYGSRPVHELSYKSVTNDNLSDISQSRLDIRNDNVHVMNNEVDKVPYYDAGNNTTSERIERRTPDAYGRSAITPSYNNNGKCSDYEDIYPKYPAGKEYRTSYKTSENSNVYDERGTKNNEGYAQNIYERNILSPTQGVHYVPSVLRRAKAQTVNSQAEGVLRPHSADFLQHEYPASRPSHPTQSSRSTQRPKSSLDINSYYDPSSDSYYSEESYAAKMRQSAQYLHSSGPAASAVAARLNTPLPLLNLNDDKQYTAPDSYATNNTSRSDVRSFANTSNYLDKDNVSYDSSKFADSSSLNSNWTLKDNRKLSLENEICNRSNSTTGDSLKVGENALGGDCFVRSASARLSSDIQEYNKDEEKKVHQREESMKRLLEWKQRMLLSPLTRKSTPAALTLARTLHRHTALPQHQAASGHRQLQIANKKSLGGSNPSINRPARDAIPIRAVSPRVRWATEKPSRNQGQEDAWNSGRDANVVEGEVGVGQGVPWAMAGVGGACALLGRSHVELQELLRDLRERHAVHATVVHRTNQQIRHLQSVLGTPEFLENRQEKLEQLEKLKLHLVELERQYSASRPLMQLVDSMVRLGALYPRAGHVQPATLDRLERNTHARHQLLLDQAQEQRRLAESTESLSREQIQRKMEQLWALDRELSSETGTLQELKADKETIEKVLGGVRDKMDASQSESDAEVKLAHVYSMLAHNSKKLEQTVGDNARLERELAALRDSLQGHTTHRTTALLEDELRRVRQLVFELQRQRQELSSAVRRLTESANLVAATPTGSLYKKRISNMSWLETDLDSGRCVEHGAEEEILTPPAYLLSAQNQSTAWMSSSQDSRQQMMPLYVDTRPTEPDMESVLSPTTSDDGTQNGFGNMTNVEKQEIKTVRIVKRESERRHRDRDRSLQPYPCDWGPMDLNLPMSHDEHYARAASLPRTANSTVQPLHAPASAMGLSMSNKTHPPSHLSLSNVNVPQNMASTWQYENAKYQSSPTLPIDNKNSSWYGSSQMTQSYNGYMPASSRHANITGTTKPASGYGDSALHRNRTSTSSVPAALSGGANSGSVASLSSSVSALSPPTFSSEAARQIMSEVREVREVPTGARRVVPRERRRHHTAPLRLSTDALQQLPKSDGFLYNEKKSSGRWLDDTDMERALRGRGRDEMSVTDATGVTGQDRPDVVRCSAPPVAKLTDAALIDQLLFAPRKILIPERYIPEKPAELSHEEQQKRLEKVESIKKMLSSGASTSDPAKQSPGGDEKKQRQHLLHMNQILAQQVMEMSKIVAVKALQNIPLDENYGSDSEDRSPDVELPVYQQRDNFFT